MPEALSLYVPGFVFLKIIASGLSWQKSEIANNVVYCVVISFILQSVTKLVVGTNLVTSTVCELALSVICAVLFICAARSEYFKSILRKTLHKTVNEDIWKDVMDYDNGTLFYITMKETHDRYRGRLLFKEEAGMDSWVVLRDCKKCGNAGTKEINYSSNPDFPRVIMLPLKDIDHVEVVYHKGTKILQQ